MFWVIVSTLIKQFTSSFTSSQILFHLVAIVTATFKTEWKDLSVLAQSVSSVISHLVAILSPRGHLKICILQDFFWRLNIRVYDSRSSTNFLVNRFNLGSFFTQFYATYFFWNDPSIFIIFLSLGIF